MHPAKHVSYKLNRVCILSCHLVHKPGTADGCKHNATGACVCRLLCAQHSFTIPSVLLSGRGGDFRPDGAESLYLVQIEARRES